MGQGWQIGEKEENGNRKKNKQSTRCIASWKTWKSHGISEVWKSQGKRQIILKICMGVKIIRSHEKQCK